MSAPIVVVELDTRRALTDPELCHTVKVGDFLTDVGIFVFPNHTPPDLMLYCTNEDGEMEASKVPALTACLRVITEQGLLQA